MRYAICIPRAKHAAISLNQHVYLTGNKTGCTMLPKTTGVIVPEAGMLTDAHYGRVSLQAMLVSIYRMEQESNSTTNV